MKPRRTAHVGLLFGIFLVLAPLSQALAETIFYDGFEGAFPGSWVVGNNSGITTAKWGDNNAKFYAGGWSAFCADNGSNSRTTYDNNLNTYMQRQGISLIGYSTPTLTFKYWLNTETSYDTFQVNVRSQSGTWTNLLTISGTSGIPSSWQTRTISLNSYAGQSNIIISFDFVSDSSAVPSGAAGVWVDEVSLTATPSTQYADLALQNLSVTRPADSMARTFTACGFDIKNSGPTALSSEYINVDYYYNATWILPAGIISCCISSYGRTVKYKRSNRL